MDSEKLIGSEIGPILTGDTDYHTASLDYILGQTDSPTGELCIIVRLPDGDLHVVSKDDVEVIDDDLGIVFIDLRSP